MKLYELINDYQEIIENNEMLEEQRKELCSLIEEELKAKENSLLFVNRNFKSDIEAIDGEIKRLQEMKKAKVNAHERFKTYVSETLKLLGMEKVKNTFGTIYLKKTETVLVDEDKIQALPVQFLKIKYEANKTELKKALKEGVAIEGVELVEGESIVFK